MKLRFIKRESPTSRATLPEFYRFALSTSIKSLAMKASLLGDYRHLGGPKLVDSSCYGGIRRPVMIGCIDFLEDRPSRSRRRR